VARLARSTVIGYPHQVTQRGNYEQTVFEEVADFQQYLLRLREYMVRYSIEIWAYCLMRNHIHFVCVPKAENALSRAFNALHMRYAQYFNGKKGISGHLWKGRFLSCMMDEHSVFEEVRYIENNPVRAGIVERAEDYPWSSARNHVNGAFDDVLTDKCYLQREIQDWRAYLADGGDQRTIKKIRKSLKTGRPAGNAEFVDKLEGIIGRRLEALPRGRPKKVIGISGTERRLR
jgi:putative transposase